MGKVQRDTVSQLHMSLPDATRTHCERSHAQEKKSALALVRHGDLAARAARVAHQQPQHALPLA
jgi:hypothetical protein